MSPTATFASRPEVLVYGDRWRDLAPGELIRPIRRRLELAERAAGADRQDHLRAALIHSGELAQGVADAAFDLAGCDAPSPAATATLELCMAVAAQLLGRQAAAALERLDRAALPASIRCKTAEGYAFYAVYPEAYAAAASAVAWPEPPLVIGLRSIGASLAPMVAAAVGGEVMTLRPAGHPFGRELRVSQPIEDALRAHTGAYLVVDEGPGLSGSSFGAVADQLEALGVAPGRIAFMPSHGGDLGPRAAARHRLRWRTARRLTADFAARPEEVAAWFADVVGPVAAAAEVSGGAWRTLLPGGGRLPAAPTGERRKFLLRTADGTYIARFAGLGTIGEDKLAVARGLHAAGFVPEPVALRRGFLLERWEDGRRLSRADGQERWMRERLAAYLGLRARTLPAARGQGAALPELRDMARFNAAALGGAGLGRAVDDSLQGLEGLDGLAPVRIDGRLHPWEWVRRADGRLCKTDALDHCQAHDLVGCQDIAWDVAGAAVEFRLSAGQTETLRRAVSAHAGRPVSPAAVSAFRLCYAAFQAAAWSMAGDAAPADAAAAHALRDGYLDVIRNAAGAGGFRRARSAVTR